MITTSFELGPHDTTVLNVTDGDFSYRRVACVDEPIGLVVRRTLEVFFHERAKHELHLYTGKFK